MRLRDTGANQGMVGYVSALYGGEQLGENEVDRRLDDRGNSSDDGRTRQCR